MQAIYVLGELYTILQLLCGIQQPIQKDNVHQAIFALQDQKDQYHAVLDITIIYGDRAYVNNAHLNTIVLRVD